MAFEQKNNIPKGLESAESTSEKTPETEAADCIAEANAAMKKVGQSDIQDSSEEKLTTNLDADEIRQRLEARFQVIQESLLQRMSGADGNIQESKRTLTSQWVWQRWGGNEHGAIREMEAYRAQIQALYDDIQASYANAKTPLKQYGLLMRLDGLTKTDDNGAPTGDLFKIHPDFDKLRKEYESTELALNRAEQGLQYAQTVLEVAASYAGPYGLAAALIPKYIVELSTGQSTPTDISFKVVEDVVSAYLGSGKLLKPAMKALGPLREPLEKAMKNALQKGFTQQSVRTLIMEMLDMFKDQQVQHIFADLKQQVTGQEAHKMTLEEMAVGRAIGKGIGAGLKKSGVAGKISKIAEGGSKTGAGNTDEPDVPQLKRKKDMTPDEVKQLEQRRDEFMGRPETPEGRTQRQQDGADVVERDLLPGQPEAILAAHDAPTIAEKARILEKAGFSEPERRALMENGVCGSKDTLPPVPPKKVTLPPSPLRKTATDVADMMGNIGTTSLPDESRNLRIHLLANNREVFEHDRTAMVGKLQGSLKNTPPADRIQAEAEIGRLRSLDFDRIQTALQERGWKSDTIDRLDNIDEMIAQGVWNVPMKKADAGFGDPEKSTENPTRKNSPDSVNSRPKKLAYETTLDEYSKELSTHKSTIEGLTQKLNDQFRLQKELKGSISQVRSEPERKALNEAQNKNINDIKEIRKKLNEIEEGVDARMKKKVTDDSAIIFELEDKVTLDGKSDSYSLKNLLLEYGKGNLSKEEVLTGCKEIFKKSEKLEDFSVWRKLTKIYDHIKGGNESSVETYAKLQRLFTERGTSLRPKVEQSALLIKKQTVPEGKMPAREKCSPKAGEKYWLTEECDGMDHGLCSIVSINGKTRISGYGAGRQVLAEITPKIQSALAPVKNLQKEAIREIDEFDKGWKVRANFDLSQPAFIRIFKDEMKYLKEIDAIVTYKIEGGGDLSSGKGSTIYIGDARHTKIVADYLEKVMQGMLYLKQDSDDVRINSVITGRFAPKSSQVRQYAAGVGKGLCMPYAIETAILIRKVPDTREAKGKAIYEYLSRMYGAYFNGGFKTFYEKPDYTK